MLAERCAQWLPVSTQTSEDIVSITPGQDVREQVTDNRYGDPLSPKLWTMTTDHEQRERDSEDHRQIGLYREAKHTIDTVAKRTQLILLMTVWGIVHTLEPFGPMASRSLRRPRALPLA
ncbi:MAG: hypothetical protein CMH53_02310 [Myxococcales bacterium]|nr:hypothetical protein [Myxococcales bacterium]